MCPWITISIERIIGVISGLHITMPYASSKSGSRKTSPGPSMKYSERISPGQRPNMVFRKICRYNNNVISKW